jgi:hypothetical protein
MAPAGFFKLGEAAGIIPQCGIFADAKSEPASVYTWLDWLEKQLPFPVHRVSKGSLEKETLVLHARKDGQGHWIHSGIPHYSLNSDGSKGHGPRQCTHYYKIDPILKYVRQMVLKEITPWKRRHKAACKEMSQWRKAVRESRRNKTMPPMKPFAAWQELQADPLVIQWIGISTDEAQRMKESRVDYVCNIWPLIDNGISRQQCLKWMESKGYPKPPRSSCVFCPYHSDHEWNRLKNEEPAEFERAVRFEKEYQRLKVQTVSKKGFFPYLHDSRTPLDTVDFAARIKAAEEKAKMKANGRTPYFSAFGNECEGMCGV